MSFSSSEVEGQCWLLNDKEAAEEERNEQLTTTEQTQSEVYRTNEELSSDKRDNRNAVRAAEDNQRDWTLLVQMK